MPVAVLMPLLQILPAQPADITSSLSNTQILLGNINHHQLMRLIISDTLSSNNVRGKLQALLQLLLASQARKSAPNDSMRCINCCKQEENRASQANMQLSRH